MLFVYWFGKGIDVPLCEGHGSGVVIPALRYSLERQGR